MRFAAYLSSSMDTREVCCRSARDTRSRSVISGWGKVPASGCIEGFFLVEAEGHHWTYRVNRLFQVQDILLHPRHIKFILAFIAPEESPAHLCIRHFLRSSFDDHCLIRVFCAHHAVFIIG